MKILNQNILENTEILDLLKEGLEDVAAGRTIPIEEVQEMFKKRWQKEKTQGNIINEY